MDDPTPADTPNTVLEGTAQCGSDDEDVDANPVAEFSSLVVKLQCNIVPLPEEDEGGLLCGKFGGKSHFFRGNCCIDQKSRSFIKVRDEEITMDMVEELRQMSELRKLHRQEADARSDGFAHLYGWFWSQDSHILVFDSLYEKFLPFLHTPDCAKPKRRHLLCTDLCNGLSFLHNFSPRLLHGAVVPENVFVSSEGRAKLTNLSQGWVHRGKWRRLCKKTKHPYTQLEELYLSPEMLKSKAVDEKHDVFSLAVLMMQILTDCIPNPKYKVGNKEETIRREDDLKILYRQHREYFEIVRKCLQQKPKHRPSACEVLKDLLNMEIPNVPSAEEVHTDSPLETQVNPPGVEPPQPELPQQQPLVVQLSQDLPPSPLIVRVVKVKDNYIEQTVKLKLSGKLARFAHSGFIPNIHYNKVDKGIYGSVHLICVNEEEDEPLNGSMGSMGSYSSMSSPTYIFVKELDRDNLPSLFYNTYKFLSNPKHIHQNVCSLLGAVVDVNVVENTTVTRIFEEFTDLNLEEFLNEQLSNSFKSVVRWIFELFDALRYLHENGIVHRRLYGNAIRMSVAPGTLSEFRVKISFLMEDDVAMYKGIKPFYRSPEYYEHGKSALGPSGDVWMAACNVILMVTRRHPWQGIPPQEVEPLISSLSSDNRVFDRLVHMDILNSELHQYQKQALEDLFQRVFLAKSTVRASANEIVRECFHFCSLSPQIEPEPKLLLSGKHSHVTRFTSVQEDTLVCCECWNETENSISLNKKVVDKMAATGVAVKVQVNYILYGAIHNKEGSTVGPAALFYSPVNFECGESVRLLIPTFGTKSSSEPIAPKPHIRASRSEDRSGSISERSWNRSYSTPESGGVNRRSSASSSRTSPSSSPAMHGCEIKPFVGEYSAKDDLYIFRESPSVSFSSCDPSRMLVHVCGPIFLQPMCLCVGHKNESEPCPVYWYEVRGYRPKDPLGEWEGENGGQVCIVVFIKSSLWELILDQEFPPEDWSFTKEIIHTSVWTKIGVSIKSKYLNKSSYIWRKDVDDINDSPSKLQERVEKGEYPMRVTFDTLKDMCSSITVTIPGEEEESKVVMEITTATLTPIQQRNSSLTLDSLKEEEYSLDSTPSQRHLLKHVLEPLGVDRAKFCIHLGVSIEQVGTAQLMGYTEVAYLQVLRPWLHGKIQLVKPTWRSVVKALHETGKVRWSEKLEEMIKKRTLK